MNKESRREDIRVGYQTAVDLTIKEEGLFWNQFSALLLANSILITATSFMEKNELLGSDFMAASGIVLCFLWFQLTKRRSDYHKYYLLSAREIEENFIAFPVQTLSRGGDFAEGGDVGMKINDKYKKHQKTLFGGLLNINYWSYCIIAIFLMIYFVYILRSSLRWFLALPFCLIILMILLGKLAERGDNMKKIVLEDSTHDRFLSIKEREGCKSDDKTISHLIDLYEKRDQQ